VTVTRSEGPLLHRISVATVYRYVREAVDLLAGLAPSLAQAIGAARRKAFVILDGS